MGAITPGVKTIAKSGSVGITGNVTLTGGSNVTLTQTGQDITITAAGGSGITTLAGDTGTATGSTVMIKGTTNQVTTSAAAATVTLALPQNIHTAATPTFAKTTVSDTTQSQLVATGWEVIGGVSAGSGQIALGTQAAAQMLIHYNFNSGAAYIDNTYNATFGDINFRVDTVGAPVTPLALQHGGRVALLHPAPAALGSPGAFINGYVNPSSYYTIGYGYSPSAAVSAPVEVGYVETIGTGYTAGDFIVATRPNDLNAVPTLRYRIRADGTDSLAVGTAGTTNTVMRDLSATWNSAGTTYTGIRENITDTASATTSLLMDLQIGGSTKLSVDKNGIVSSGGSSRVTTQFDKTNDATLANVTGLTATVTAGKTYAFTAILFVNPDAVAGHKYAIGGTATATAIIYQVNSINNATNANILNSRQTALGGAAGVVGGTTDYTEIKGTITVNIGGTLTVQFAQQVATAATTSSVLVGSIFDVEQIA